MKSPAAVLELPLHLVGISDRVTHWLREAGFPVIRLGQESLWKSAFRGKGRHSDRSTLPLKRFLLFDSRDVWSRALVKMHQKHSLAKLDAARLLVSLEKEAKSAGKSRRVAFLEQLKTTLESLGGVWVRLADLPFPYRGIGCVTGDLPNADSPGNRSGRLDVIQQRYLAGLPTAISQEDLSELAELPPVSGLESPGLPLLWRVDQADFAAWWNYRNHLQVEVWQTDTHYQIECPRSDAPYCPVLEIWRGSHVASVPLRSESVIVRKEGLVFQQQPLRHPAGFTIRWPDNPADVGLPQLSA